MKQRGPIFGYRQVYWNGVTTLELAKAIDWMFTHKASGLVHLASPQKISKFDLLTLWKDIFEFTEVDILPNDDHPSDKSLLNTRTDFTFDVQPYRQMYEQMRAWMQQ
jgi:dTDP-4-dehydrorhamnose reductase